MNYLLADTVTGICEVKELEGENCEVLSQHEFYESLGDLKPGVLIGCEVEAEYWVKLDTEYGIQLLQ